MRYLLLLFVILLAACSGEEKFEGKLFCTEKQAFVIKYHVGRWLYRFDRTEVADKLCEGPTP